MFPSAPPRGARTSSILAVSFLASSHSTTTTTTTAEEKCTYVEKLLG